MNGITIPLVLTKFDSYIFQMVEFRQHWYTNKWMFVAIMLELAKLQMLPVGGLAQMVERSLSMWEVPGSIPGFSKYFFSISHYKCQFLENDVTRHAARDFIEKASTDICIFSSPGTCNIVVPHPTPDKFFLARAIGHMELLLSPMI